MKKPNTEYQIHRQYWLWNIGIMTILLTAWAIIGLGAGILFADVLNNVNLPNTGLPLGFWMAQQGSIIGFVVIILAYCVSLNYLDKHHQRQLSQLDSRGSK